MWGRHKRPRSLPMTGECVAPPLPKPPLMVRGGVERSEPEGIKEVGFRYSKSNHRQTIPQSAALTAPFAQGSQRGCRCQLPLYKGA